MNYTISSAADRKVSSTFLPLIAQAASYRGNTEQPTRILQYLMHAVNMTTPRTVRESASCTFGKLVLTVEGGAGRPNLYSVTFPDAASLRRARQRIAGAA